MGKVIIPMFKDSYEMFNIIEDILEEIYPVSIVNIFNDYENSCINLTTTIHRKVVSKNGSNII